jgi:membrane protein implicated in regulation of membrane protease activity
MVAWWLALGTVGQVFACIAIPATVMLIIQMILTLIGLGGDDMDAQTDGADADGIDTDIDDSSFDDADMDIADGGLRVFTLRGLIAFFSVTGWVGTVCCNFALNLPVTIIISVASGLLAMFLIAALLKWLLKLQYDGTEDIKDALGVSGTVYLKIPPARSGKGKVNVLVQGKLCEKDAVTDEETIINRDEEITVIGISGGETLIVRRKNRK